MKTYQGHEWSHKGLLYGFVPVYINEPYSEAPEITVRHWSLEFLADFAEALFATCCKIKRLIDPSYEPQFFFKITGDL